MANELSFIEELGIGINPNESDTEASSEDNTGSNPDEDLNSDSTDNVEETTGTEQLALMESLKKQIEGMEKRINDKDKYIEELRNKSKSEEIEQEVDDEDVDFWDNPEGMVNKLKQQKVEQDRKLHIQSLQISEIHYANTVENYWKTVNQDALKEAVATDAGFAESFNKSKEPYKLAYEYLTNRTKEKATKESSLEAEIRAKLMKEYGLKEKKVAEAPPSMNRMGSSSGSKYNEVEDGFTAVFGGM
jgi:hypothetical protein